MNRRGFLSLLGAGAAGLVLDPELLLWRPGAKTIFLPPQRVFTAWPENPSLLMLGREMLQGLIDNYASAGIVTSGVTDHYKIGHRVYGSTLTNQRSVHGYKRPRDREDMSCWVDLLADGLKEKRLTRFAQLDLPPYGEAVNVFDRRTGLSVRVVESYDLDQGAHVLRFDVLGAT